MKRTPCASFGFSNLILQIDTAHVSWRKPVEKIILELSHISSPWHETPPLPPLRMLHFLANSSVCPSLIRHGKISPFGKRSIRGVGTPSRGPSPLFELGPPYPPGRGWGVGVSLSFTHKEFSRKEAETEAGVENIKCLSNSIVTADREKEASNRKHRAEASDSR